MLVQASSAVLTIYLATPEAKPAQVWYTTQYMYRFTSDYPYPLISLVGTLRGKLHFLLGGRSKASNTAKSLYRVEGFLMDLTVCRNRRECVLRGSGIYQHGRKRPVNCIVQKEKTNYNRVIFSLLRGPKKNNHLGTASAKITSCS